jgi:DNA repair protein RecO (recombination protein O)
VIEKDQAIALRIAPYSNTSRFVLWLTREHGKIATLIKGAQRPKSAFLGQFDLFYTCELLYYARDRGGIHIARECAPLKTRAALRGHWRACLFASYFADLLARALPDGAAAPAVYDWMEATLDELARPAASPEPVFRSELGLLDHLGFRPVLNRCAACGRPIEPRAPRVPFSPARGGRLCPECAPSARDARPAAADALAILAAWQDAETPEEARRTRCSPRQALAMEQILGEFLRHHLDLDPESRRIAFEGARPPRKSGSVSDWKAAGIAV